MPSFGGASTQKIVEESPMLRSVCSILAILVLVGNSESDGREIVVQCDVATYNGVGLKQVQKELLAGVETADSTFLPKDFTVEVLGGKKEADPRRIVLAINSASATDAEMLLGAGYVKLRLAGSTNHLAASIVKRTAMKSSQDAAVKVGFFHIPKRLFSDNSAEFLSRASWYINRDEDKYEYRTLVDKDVVRIFVFSKGCEHIWNYAFDRKLIENKELLLKFRKDLAQAPVNDLASDRAKVLDRIAKANGLDPWINPALAPMLPDSIE